MSSQSSLTHQDFADLFGCRLEELRDERRRQISATDFTYRAIDGAERDHILLDIFKRIDEDRFSLAGKEGKARWERGWAENFDNFISSGSDISALVPKYIRNGQPVRLRQQYVATANSEFELRWYEIFRAWLFETYLSDVESIYEFGCGSGFNLATLAQRFPEKRYFGLDWAQPSVDIVNAMGKRYGWDMHGQVFDFFSPSRDFRVDPGGAVLTMGALEQTGRDHKKFLDYLLEMRPRRCVHIEPIVEWYDESNLVDYAAIRFHLKRNYWQGFPNRLRELEQQGRVRILKAKRSYFGSLYIEGYSQLIWEPVR